MQKHKKNLGQHFLHDKNIINKIINSFEISKNDLFLEIGPGEGALTTSLVDKPKNTSAFFIASFKVLNLVFIAKADLNWSIFFLPL